MAEATTEEDLEAILDPPTFVANIQQQLIPQSTVTLENNTFLGETIRSSDDKNNTIDFISLNRDSTEIIGKLKKIEIEN